MKHLKTLALLLVVMALLTACGAAGGGGTNVSVNDVGNVEGTVTDSTTENPLSGVTVKIGDKSDVTGDDGVYSIQDIDVGTRTVTASKTGYQNHNGTCEISKGTTVSHDVQLTANSTSDTTPPTVSSTSPANNAADIAVNSSVTVTFSEAMDVSTITTTTFTLNQGITPVSGTVTYSGTTATFTPSSILSYSTAYTASITTGAMDTTGNALASDYSWSFTTGTTSDTVPPTVSSTSPANNAVDIAVNSALTATFSEAMDVSTITTTTFTLKQGITPVSGTVTYSGTTATFTPSSTLSYSTAYTASITTGAMDTTGNAMASDYSWSFTTGTASDTGPPTVSSTSPANNATGIAINSTITATFSENMVASTITSATFTLKQGTTAISGTVTYNGTTATFTPSNSLSYSTTYTATITTGAIDSAGNAMASSYSWSFTTGAQPPSAPSAPTGVTATAGDGQVAISWNSVSGATSYNIYWSTMSGATKTNGTKISYATSPYTHTGLTNGTTYYYVVTANGSGESSESSQVSATPQGGATNPVTSDASGIMDTTASLGGSFNNPSGYTTTAWFEYGTTTSYGLSTPSQGYGGAGSMGVGANLTGLEGGTTYHFRLVTQNSGGTFYGSDKTFTTYVTPETIASGSLWDWVALDATNVYFVDNNVLKKVDKNGGVATTLATGLGASCPKGIAMDAANLYFTEGETKSVNKVSISSGTVTTLATGSATDCYTAGSPSQKNWNIAIDDTNVYFTDYTAKAVKKVSKNGGTVTTLVSGLSSPTNIVVDASYVYFQDGSSLNKIDKNGGSVIIWLTSGLYHEGNIAIDATNIYFSSGIQLKKMGLGNGTVSDITLSSDQFFFSTGAGIVIDDSNLYFTDYGKGIKKVGISGGSASIVTVLYSGLYKAVDDTSVYFIEGGNIRKIAK